MIFYVTTVTVTVVAKIRNIFRIIHRRRLKFSSNYLDDILANRVALRKRKHKRHSHLQRQKTKYNMQVVQFEAKAGFSAEKKSLDRRKQELTDQSRDAYLPL